MRKSFVLLIAFVAFGFAAGEAWSKVTMTEQQVRNVCGKKLQSGKVGNVSSIGCEKKCGTKYCVYGCITEKGKQTCEGDALF